MSDTRMGLDEEKTWAAETAELDGSPLEDDPWRGRTLDDKYEVIDKLGEGGMGAVYEAVHRRIGRHVAIKMLRPELAAHPLSRHRFEREARAAAAAGHPNVVQVTDIGELRDGGTYLVLELLRGRELADDLAEGPQDVAKVARIARQICGGLGALHACGIVHRDLKPSNIFLVRHLDDPDFVKIVDFGIAKFLSSEGEHASFRATRTGAVLGTPIYMSPEQAEGRKDIDHRADVYSLGVILYEALTGRCPFESDTVVRLFFQICHVEPTPPRSLRPELPEALEAVVLRMLAKAPDERFQSCDEVAAALAPFAAGDVPTPPSEVDLALADTYERPAPRAAQGGTGPDELAPAHAVTREVWARAAPTLSATSNEAALASRQGSPPETPLPNEAPTRTESARPGWRRAAVPAALLLALGAGLGWLASTRLSGSTDELPQVPGAPSTALAPAVLEPDVGAPPPAQRPAGTTVSTTDGTAEGTSPLEATAPPEAAPAPLPSTPTEPPSRARPSRESRATPAGPATLILVTRPWARVWINGVEAGNTPIYRRSVPSGRLRIELQPEGRGPRRRLVVNARPGETVSRNLDL